MDGSGGNPYTVASGKLPYTPLSMKHQLLFIHHCLLYTVDNSVISVDIHAPLNNHQVVQQLRQNMATSISVEVIHQYIAIIKYTLSPVSGT